MTTSEVRQSCAYCHNAAAKAGRPVRMTEVCEYPICPVCEARVRNGLLHYRPSNGTEGMIFEERCERCRHYIDDGESAYSYNLDKPVMCQFGILDRMKLSGWGDHDSSTNWYDPADLRTKSPDGELICPAECLRFTDKDDPDGARRDPPPKDCEGQMFFGDIDVPVERVRAKESSVA